MGGYVQYGAHHLQGYFCPCLHPASPCLPLGPQHPAPATVQPLWASPASLKAQSQDAADEGSSLTRDSQAPCSAAGSSSCCHRPHCHPPFLARWPRAVAKRHQPLAEPWWCLAFPSLAVPESKPGLCGQADQGCLLLPDSAKEGGVTSLRCHHSLPEFCLCGQQGLAAVQRSSVRCWCAAVLAAASRHNSLQAGKTSHPSTAAVGGAGARAHPMGSPGMGAQRAQPDPKPGCSGTTCLHCPSPTRPSLLRPPHPLWSPQPGASPSLWASPEPLGREGSSPVTASR